VDAHAFLVVLDARGARRAPRHLLLEQPIDSLRGRGGGRKRRGGTFSKGQLGKRAKSRKGMRERGSRNGGRGGGGRATTELEREREKRRTSIFSSSSFFSSWFLRRRDISDLRSATSTSDSLRLRDSSSAMHPRTSVSSAFSFCL
jgi:hypothetical protein